MQGIMGNPELSDGESCFLRESEASILGLRIGNVERRRIEGHLSDARTDVSNWSTPSLFFFSNKHNY